MPLQPALSAAGPEGSNGHSSVDSQKQILEAPAATRPEGDSEPEKPRRGPAVMIGLLLVVLAGIGVMSMLRSREAGEAAAQATGTRLALLAVDQTETAAGLAAQQTGAAQPSDTPLPSPTSEPSATPDQTAAVLAAPANTPGPTATPEGYSPYRLAFYSNKDGAEGLYLMDPDHPDDFMLVPAPTDYELFSWPTFCGDELAFEAADRSLELPIWIFQYRLPNGAITPLTIVNDPPTRAMQPGCSPDGRYLGFTAFRNGRRSLSWVNRETNTILYERPAGDYATLGNATWLLEEDLVLWMGVRSNGYFDINQTSNISEESPGPNRVLAQGKYPAISPDGSRLVYFCGNLLYLCMVERPSDELLFQIPVSYFKKINKKAVPATAAWSMDGKWVYFSSSILGNWDIYRMRPDGRQVQNLTEAWTSDEYMPAAR